MKARGAASWTCVLALLTSGCNTASRHKTLTTFFDGVPPPHAAEPTKPQQSSATTIGAPSRQDLGSEHGPYAAKLCNACHVAGATNALVAPNDELCVQCHTIALDKKFLHGPLTSGGCLACHDPHSSRYPSLLVSDSGTFCLGCHDRDTVANIEGHGNLNGSCTTCHDAHGSDTKYLLK
jgi:predicted CXXCH cytochrome family protein